MRFEIDGVLSFWNQRAANIETADKPEMERRAVECSCLSAVDPSNGAQGRPQAFSGKSKGSSLF
jgi:hypothetical protein